MKPKRTRRAKAAPGVIVRKAELAELEAFYAMRLHHYIAELDGQHLAMGTLSRAGGRLWGWFDVREGLTSRQRMAVIYAIMKGLRGMREPIYVTSNEGVHQKAMRLLRSLGFRTTGEHVHGRQVWVWNRPDADVAPIHLDEANHDRT